MNPPPLGGGASGGVVGQRADAGFKVCGNVSGPLPLTPSPKGRGDVVVQPVPSFLRSLKRIEDTSIATKPVDAAGAARFFRPGPRLRTAKREAMAETAGPLLEDDAGTRFASAGPEARIACFVPSITELLVDLGLKDRLVARTRFCIHPAEAVARIPAIGGTKKVNLRKLEALAPTHAVLNIDENTVEMAEAMRGFVPNVVVTHPLVPEDNLRLYALMGGLFGKADEASALARRFEAARAALPPAGPAAHRDVLYFIWKDPWMTVSRDTYISAMLGLIGWRTTHHDPDVRYPTVDLTPETVAATDLFLFPTEPYEFTRAEVDAFLRDHDCPPEKALMVDGEYCSWYGSRAIAGLRYLGELAERVRRRG